MSDLDFGVEDGGTTITLPVTSSGGGSKKKGKLTKVDDNIKFITSQLQERKILNRHGNYTLAYKKHIRNLLKEKEGLMNYFVDKTKLYNVETDRFVKKTVVLNKRTGGLKQKYVNQGYTLNEYGNMISTLPPEEEHEYIVFGVVDVTFALKGEGIFHKDKLTKTQTIKCKPSRLKKKLTEFLKREIKRIKKEFEDSELKVIRITLLRYYVNQIKETDIQLTKMYGAMTIPMSYIGSKIMHDGIIDGDCVPRMLLNHINNPNETNPRRRLKKVNIDMILDLLNEKSYNPSADLDYGLDESTTQVKTDDDRMYKGYNALQIKYVCNHFKIPMYAIDYQKNIFMNNLNELKNDRNTNLPSLVFCCANNHMYVIDSHEEKENVIKRTTNLNEKLGARNKKIIKGKEKRKQKVEEFTKLCNDIQFEVFAPSVENMPTNLLQSEDYNGKIIYITCKENIVSKLFYEEIKQGRIHDDEYLKVCEDDKVVRFNYFNKVKLCYNPQFPIIYKTCSKLNSNLREGEIPYNPHTFSLPSLVLEYYKRHYGHKDSQLGVDGWDIMNSNLNTALNEFWKMPNDWDDVHAYDIAKHYSSCLMNCVDGWAVYNPMDEVRKYSGELLKTGYYYVETSCGFPLSGNGWYCEELLKECINDGIITNKDIKYEFVSSTIISGSHFEQFVKDIFNIFEDGAKDGINGFIGLMRKTHTTRHKHSFTQSFQDLARYGIKKDFKNMRIKVVENDNEQEVCFHTIDEIKLPHTYTNLPIFRKIYDLSRLQTYKLAKQVGISHMIGIWTDSLFFCGGKRLNATEHTQPIGGIRHIQFNKDTITEIKQQYIRTDKFEEKYNEWDEVNYDENIWGVKGCMITGCAGSGKSTLCNKIKNKLQNGYAVCTPTHKASIRVNGNTIHKLFGIDPRLNIISHALCQQLKSSGVKVIFIDEISMISSCIWGLIYIIKKKYDFTFIGFGDFYQLPPVLEEKYYAHYKRSKLLNYIFDGQYMELTTNYRVLNNPSSRTFYEQLDKARLGQKIDKNLFGQNVCEFALAWSNKNVDAHNKLIMNKKIKDIEHEILTDDMYLYIGLPIIACETFSDYVNNEDFIVVSYDTEKILIKNERQELEITREVLLRDFKPFYACTVHKAQGMEFNFPYTIYGWNYMSPNMLYTAISRSTCLENVNLVWGIKNNICKTGYVYMYTNKSTGMSYIGSTFNIEERKKQHTESKENDKFHKAVRQYGIEEFDLVILAEYNDVNDRELRQLEGQWIHNNGTIVNGYNTDNIKNPL